MGARRALGLVPADNIDALITQDLAPGAFYAPGFDFVAFSLAPFSPTLGAIGAGPGDLLMAVPGGPPAILIPAAALGLGPMDDLDAIDVVLPQAGDYTNDGRVDKRDYVVWRNTLGMPVFPAGSGTDGNGDGMVGAADFAIWRANFGMPAGPGPGAGAGAGLLGVAIPEPSATVLALVGIAAVFSVRRSQLIGRNSCGHFGRRYVIPSLTPFIDSPFQIRECPPSIRQGHTLHFFDSRDGSG